MHAQMTETDVHYFMNSHPGALTHVYTDSYSEHGRHSLLPPRTPYYTTTTKVQRELQAAVDTARRADKDIANPAVYQQAIKSLSDCISKSVRARLLPETVDVAKRARQRLKEMKANLNNAIDSAKKKLSDAISMAKNDRKPGPLVACLDRMGDDTVLQEKCSAAIQEAKNLLTRLREKATRKASWRGRLSVLAR